MPAQPEKTLPKLVIDTREQKPLSFGQLRTIRKKLEFGDYSLQGFENRVAIERKSLQDLWGTVSQQGNWARFDAELSRAQSAGCRLHIVVEASPAQVLKPSKWCVLPPARVLDRLWESCHRFGMAATFACGRATTAPTVLAILRGAFRAENSY